MSDPVIMLEKICFSYEGLAVLKQVDLAVERGAFVGLAGPNGGGKSTLLKIILGLLRPQSGRVTIFGRPPREAQVSIGYVPQFAMFARDFPISVKDAVLLGRLGKTNRTLGYRYSLQDRDVATQAMQETGIADIQDRPLGSLSGGQLQRALIARALACQPEILMLDEPTSNIDMRAEEDIFDLLKQINTRMTILTVSHDIGFISRYVTQMACLNQTLLCHQTGSLSEKTIEELYQRPVHAIHHY
ncbi:MAG: metal ABC transporter ATP-binding protein [Gammaproteobacteria bacterium]|nr:metal ABC transporter ATP-binding protein [Gammaproteobacteria bacterium]